MLNVSFSYLCALCQVTTGALSPYGRLLSSGDRAGEVVKDSLNNRYEGL